MSKYLFIGKALTKGTSKEASNVIEGAAKGIRATKTLADGTKITSSVVQITKKASKGCGEVGAKGIIVFKAKLKEVKSLIKKKRSPKHNSSKESVKENWQSKSDVYDEWEWKAQEPFEQQSSSNMFIGFQEKAVEKAFKPINKGEEKILDPYGVIGRDLINKPKVEYPNLAPNLYEKTNIITPKKNIDFGI